jgi:hypothetical protein
VDPPWVNDEGTYFAVAQAMNHGYALYRDIWENKPPVLYLGYAEVYHWLGPSLLAVRVAAAVAVVVTVALVASLAHRYVPHRWAVTALLAGLLLGVPFLEGTTANAEVFLVVWTSLGVLLALRGALPWAGLCMAIAVGIKAVAAFDAVALGLYLVFQRRAVTDSIRIVAPYVLFLAAGLGSIAVLCSLAGILRPMLADAVLYDLGYVGRANGGGIPWLALLKAGVLLLLTVPLVRRPFPFLWLLWAAAGALVSGRFFGHYALQAVPPLCLVAGMALDRRPFKSVPSRTLQWALPACFVLMAGLAALAGWSMSAAGDNSILARRLQWYPNFIRYTLGTESYATYRGQVDDHVNRNIRVAAAVRSLPPGKLLVWGNTPWIYVLSGRLPATPYTSAERDPEVPGETARLARAVRGRHARVVVVINPPLPPIPAAVLTPAAWREVRRIDDAAVYVARARRGR